MSSNKAAATKPWSLWSIFWRVTLFALLVSIAWLALRAYGVYQMVGGDGGLRMIMASYTPRDVVGDLGGMPVLIPRHMAELVEYEGDPGWSGKREGPVPKRTYDSKLTSFGVDFRYPDMATLSSPEMFKDQRSKTIFNTDWMRFGVSTGDRYPGDGFLDRRIKSALGRVTYDKYIYSKQATYQHGLIPYLLIDKSTGYRDKELETIFDRALFIKNDSNGKTTTYIECIMVEHMAAPCSQSFSLESQGISAEIRVSYRIGFLKNWKDIQEKVTQKIFTFKKITMETTNRKTNYETKNEFAETEKTKWLR